MRGTREKRGTMTDRERKISQINSYLQRQLRLQRFNSVTAVEGAQWLDQAGILKDAPPPRTGLPLRRFLREGVIVGQRQEDEWWWFIDRVE